MAKKLALKSALFVIVIQCFCCATAGFLFDDPAGKVSPTDVYAILGEELNFTCTVLKDGLNASQIFFELDDIRVPSSHTTIISSNQLQCRLPVTQQNFSVGYHMLLCVDGLTGLPLDTTSIKVDNALHNVTDLGCVIILSEKKIRCTWTRGYYEFEQHISVNFFVGINCEAWTKCKSIQGNTDQSCEFTEDDQLVIHPMLICFKLEVTNTNKSLRKTVHLNYSDADKIVKPKKAENLRRLQTMSRAVQLAWQYPEGTASEYYVNLSVSSEGQIRTEEFTSLNNKTLKDLKPNTKYDISLRLRLTNGVFYSDAVTINFTTDIDIPDVPPRLPDGSFHMDSNDCKQKSTTSTRNITLYWKPIPEEYWNSPSLNYTVTYAPLYGLRNEPQKPTSVTVDDHNLSVKLTLWCEMEYVVKVKGGNKKGYSNDSNTLTVPKYRGGPQLEDIVVQVPEDQSMVNISWQEDHKDCTYVVFWCTNPSADLNCKNEIQYAAKRTPGSSHVILNSNETNDIGGSRFGVSKQRLNYTSGITWEKCRYRQDSAPPTPGGFSLAPVNPDGALTVRWSFPECDLQSGYLQKYRLKYCRVQGENHTDCQEEAFMRPVQPEYTVRDLQLNQQYSLRLQALSPLDKESFYTDSVMGTPILNVNGIGNHLSTDAMLGIGFGSTFGFIFLVAGLVFSIRYVYRKMKSVAKPYDITVPNIERSRTNPSYQSLKEKGYKSGPPDKDNDGVPKSPHKHKEENETPHIFRQMSHDSGTGSLDMHQPNLTPITEGKDPFVKEQNGGKSGEANATFTFGLPLDYSRVTLDGEPTHTPNCSFPPQQHTEMVVGFVVRDPVNLCSSDGSSSQQDRVEVLDGEKGTVNFSRAAGAKIDDKEVKNAEQEGRSIGPEDIDTHLQEERSSLEEDTTINPGHPDIGENLPDINSGDLFGSGAPEVKVSEQGQGQEDVDQGHFVGENQTGHEAEDEVEFSRCCDTSSIQPGSQPYITTSALQQPRFKL